MLYLTEQIGIGPKTGRMISGDSRDPTQQVLLNLEVILNAAGSSVDE